MNPVHTFRDPAFLAMIDSATGGSPPGGGGGGGGGPVPEGWLHYWAFDDADGPWADAIGDLDLVDDELSGTVTSETGLLNGAVRLAVSSGPTRTLATGMESITGSALVSFWWRQSSVAASVGWGIGMGQHSVIFNPTSNRVQFSVLKNGLGYSVTASSFGAVPTNEWHLCTAWFDAAAGKVKIRIDDGPVDEAAGPTSTSPITSAAITVTTEVAVTVDFDEAGFYHGLLDSEALDALWNDGVPPGLGGLP